MVLVLVLVLVLPLVDDKQSFVPIGQVVDSVADEVEDLPKASIFAVQEVPCSVRNGVRSERPPVKEQQRRPVRDDKGWLSAEFSPVLDSWML